MAPATLLSRVRDKVSVDVDSMDPDVAARHTTDAHKFRDMTSNQAIVYSEAVRPERAHVFNAAVAQIRSAEAQLDIDSQVSNALDLLTVLLAKEVFPHLTGRVHAQASPTAAYDTEATIQHAKKLVALFEANGIPKSRVCIKIPATPESIVACNYLERLGIRTLATCLFSVPQAMAAHQAGCLYVAPYFNELRVHFEPGVWKEYTDTAREHPMGPVIGAIVELFKDVGSRTLVMPASIVTAKEVLALVSLSPDHLTLSGAVLDQLAAAEGPAELDTAPQPHHPDVSLGTAPVSGKEPAGKSKGGCTVLYEFCGPPRAGTERIPAVSFSCLYIYIYIYSFCGWSGVWRLLDVWAVAEPDARSVNYLENGAAALRDAFTADAESSRKMADALKIFGEMETKTKELLRAALQAY
ncbi:hypothetical protein BD413DRAFT_507413 [Trametes elegans]|nr:hypothetical protein BD413DRAFT_507413 [Trametes elegans]